MRREVDSSSSYLSNVSFPYLLLPLQHPDKTIGFIRWQYYSNQGRFQAMVEALKEDPSLSSFSWEQVSTPHRINPNQSLLSRISSLKRSRYEDQSLASGSYPPPPPPFSANSSPTTLPAYPSSAPVLSRNHQPSQPPPLSTVHRKTAPSFTRNLEPPSFFELGVGPSLPSTTYCYFCGVGDASTQFIRKIELAEPSRLVCDICLSSLNDRIYQGEELGRMGVSQKLEWVVGALKVNGIAKRRMSVRIEHGGMVVGNR